MPAYKYLTLILIYSVLGGISCGQSNSELPSVVSSQNVDEVELTEIVKNVARYNSVRAKVRGISRIEFEGNALFPDRDAFQKRQNSRALWLDLGWPVRIGSPDLNGRYVIVEGIIDANAKGHEAAFAATITQITRIEAAESP